MPNVLIGYSNKIFKTLHVHGRKKYMHIYTVYHITSRPKKQAFLGPITKLVAKLVARHKTSRIKGI